MSNAILLRMPQVLEVTSLKRSTFLKLVKDGLFPQPIKLTVRTNAWNGSEVLDWIAARKVA